jgi:hypothetical protein
MPLHQKGLSPGPFFSSPEVFNGEKETWKIRFPKPCRFHGVWSNAGANWIIILKQIRNEKAA